VRLQAKYVARLALSFICVVSAAMPARSSGEDLAAKSKHGNELMAAGRYAEAAPVYRELVEALPGNPGLLLNLGMALHLAAPFS
jgi:Flp pilus assembly protein TadD